MDEATVLAQQLNGDARSGAADRAALDETLRLQGDEFCRELTRNGPHLFAGVPLFLSQAQVDEMRAVIAAVERVAALPGWRAGMPQLPEYEPRARGVFFGYDFHLNAAGAHLIEINTNAGGAFFNALLLRSQADVPMPGEPAGPDDAVPVFLEMFRDEWRLQRGDAPLRHVAIVDEQPLQQFMHPEFVLARRMFEHAGMRAWILDPSELEARSDGLYHDGCKIDLIYNRLTDFSLERHPVLAEAWTADRVVLTPHPHAYALYADKRNLARLSDAVRLRALGADEDAIDTLLRCVPQTVRVRAQEAEQWWAGRKQWFFKPATGFGSKGSYRGENITRRVFEEILRGDYVAQRLAVPGQRIVPLDGAEVPMKFDIRCYAYGGEMQLIAASLYQGQTHNARTPGGGYAPARIVG